MNGHLSNQYKALEGLIDMAGFIECQRSRQRILDEIEQRSSYINEIHKAKRNKKRTLTITLSIESKMNLLQNV